MQPTIHDGKPAVNIKCYKGIYDASLPLDLGRESSDGGKTWNEMKSDPAFTHQWIQDNMKETELMDWWYMVSSDAVDQYAEHCKEMFQEAGYDVEIYTGGRSGGWLEVHGLEDLLWDWPEDLQDLWESFVTQTEEAVENFPSYFASEIYYGVYEAKQAEEDAKQKDIEAIWDQVHKALDTVIDLYHQGVDLDAFKEACPLLVAKVEDSE